jgi:hypothetical protein
VPEEVDLALKALKLQFVLTSNNTDIVAKGSFLDLLLLDKLVFLGCGKLLLEGIGLVLGIICLPLVFPCLAIEMAIGLFQLLNVSFLFLQDFLLLPRDERSRCGQISLIERIFLRGRAISAHASATRRAVLRVQGCSRSSFQS